MGALHWHLSLIVKKRKAGLIWIMSLVLLAVFSSVCRAQSTPITITQRDQLNFGTIGGENGTCSLSGNGKLSGSGGQTCTGWGVPATFVIEGARRTTVVVSVFQGVAVNGITFVPEISGYPILNLGGNGRASLTVIGSLQLNSARGGSISLPYTLSVNYQ